MIYSIVELNFRVFIHRVNILDLFRDDIAHGEVVPLERDGLPHILIKRIHPSRLLPNIYGAFSTHHTDALHVNDRCPSLIRGCQGYRPGL